MYLLAVAEQCLQGIKASSVSHSALPAVSRLGVGKSLGEVTIETADLNGPEGYSRPYVDHIQEDQ